MAVKKYAVVESGIVTNTFLLDESMAETWPLPDGATLVESAMAGIGDSYDGETFTPPEPVEVDPLAPYMDFAEMLTSIFELLLTNRGLSAFTTEERDMLNEALARVLARLMPSPEPEPEE